MASTSIRRVRRRGRQRRVDARRRPRMRVRRRDLRRLHAAHHRADGRRAGPAVDACAREIYTEWAAYQHFELYDDVPAVLRELIAAGIRVGLISNSHRCLASFQSHFELRGHDRRGRVVRRSRIHEAAPEHLSGGAAAGGRGGRRGASWSATACARMSTARSRRDAGRPAASGRDAAPGRSWRARGVPVIRRSASCRNLFEP